MLSSSRKTIGVLYRRLFVIAIWGFSLLWMLRKEGGVMRLTALLHPSFWWLIVCGGVIMAMFAVVTLLQEKSVRDNTSTHHHPPSALGVFEIGLILLPLLYLPLALDSQLGTGAYRNRSLRASGIILPKTLDERLDLLSRKNIAASTNAPAEVFIYKMISSLEDYYGKRVSTTGMFYRNGATPADGFICFRFLITCCAADAAPFGILVKAENIDGLKINDWVQVQGLLGSIELDGKTHLAIIAEEVKKVKRPGSPFMY